MKSEYALYTVTHKDLEFRLLNTEIIGIAASVSVLIIYSFFRIFRIFKVFRV